MTTARVLYVIFAILCGGLAYASMQYLTKMDDAVVMLVVSVWGVLACLYRLSETFTNNHS